MSANAPQFTKGGLVHINGTTISGTVKAKHYNEQTESFEYSIEWEDSRGERHIRRFSDQQISTVVG